MPSFDSSVEYSGGAPPAGTPSWLEQFMRRCGDLAASDEFATIWLSNIEPLGGQTDLHFCSPTKAEGS